MIVAQSSTYKVDSAFRGVHPFVGITRFGSIYVSRYADHTESATIIITIVHQTRAKYISTRTSYTNALRSDSSIFGTIEIVLYKIPLAGTPERVPASAALQLSLDWRTLR